MASPVISSRRIKIDKANATIVTVLAISSFLIVFSLISAKSLLNQYSFQNRVTKAQGATLTDLKSDVQATNQLVLSYEKFNNGATNAIGGSSTGSGSNQGDNAKIVLDALPSEYDYPQFVTSLNNILKNQGVTITGITASNLVSQTTGAATPVGSPVASSGTAIPLPFNFTATGTYKQIQTMFSNLELVVEPIQIDTITLTGSDSAMSATVAAHVFYQPGISLTLGTETIR